MLYNFLFPRYSSLSYRMSLLLLCARMIFGTLFMIHGLQKLFNYHDLLGTFPDPIGLGGELSLVMAITAELFCSLAFMFGFLYRIVMIPMIFTMIVAVFVVHSGDPLAVRELALVYLFIFIALYITGPGKYAFDYLISSRRNYKVQLEESC